MPALSSRALGRATLARQHLITPTPNAGPASVAALVADLVGMQAQHPQSFYTGLFSRIADFTPDDAAQVGELLTSGEFKTNVIVMTHIRWVERQDGTKKAFPSAVGEALSPKIGTYFNNLLLSESSGTGAAVKRTFKTLPTTFMDLKNTGAEDLPATLPIETGLADFFKAVQL